MTQAPLYAVLAPAFAAAMAVLLVPSPRLRRAIALLGLAGGAFAAAWAFAEVLGGGTMAARGFEADAWRAGLALAALVVAAAGLDPRGARGDQGASIAVGAHVAAAAAGAGAVLATDAFSAAGFFVAGSVAFGIAAAARSSNPGRRAAMWYGLGDVLAVIGLVLLAQDGMRIPLSARGTGAGLLLAAAAIKSGAVPVPRWFDAVLDDDALLGSIASGPLRAQGFAIAGWVALGAQGWASASMVLLGAIGAALAARRASRSASAPSALCAHGGLVLAGLGLGGVAGSGGAVLVAAGAFLAAMLVLLGASRVGAPAIAAAPLGATLPGAVLIASTALERGGTMHVLGGTAALAAIVWLAVAGVAGLRAGASTRTAPSILASVPVAAALAIAVVPGRAFASVAAPVAVSLGVGRPLIDPTSAFGDAIGFAFAAAALGGSIAVLPRREVTEPGRDDVAAATPPDEPQPMLTRITAALFAAASVGVLVLLWVGIDRGFL